MSATGSRGPRGPGTLLRRDPPIPYASDPGSAGLCQRPSYGCALGSRPRWGGESQGRGSGWPRAHRIPAPPRGPAPLLPVHARLSPLRSWQHRLCHPTPAARATPELAARVTACAVAHAQLGVVPVALPGPRGCGCAGRPRAGLHGATRCPSRCSGGAGLPSAAEAPAHRQPWLAAALLPVAPQSPGACQHRGHVASNQGRPLPVPSRANSSPWGIGARWHVPPPPVARPLSCVARSSCAQGMGHGAWGRTSRRSAWLSTCRRLFLART